MKYNQTILFLLLTICSAIVVNLVDAGANEVQATLMVLLPLSFLLGLLQPKRAWLGALVIGLSLPFTTWLALSTRWFTLREIPEPTYAGAIALIPAFIGSYAGALFRYAMRAAIRQA
jgi:hypothetical protein